MSEVVWNIVRKNSAYLVRRNGIELAAEKGNLKNTNSYKFSGFAQGRTVDVNLQNSAKRIKLGVAIPVKSNKPRYDAGNTALANGSVIKRNGIVAKAVGPFRRDLQKAALARFTALHRGQTRPASFKPKVRKGIRASA